MAYRILIIDDEEDIRAIAAMALDLNLEFDVRTCGSGAEGLQIAEWWLPHLILLDVRMPGLSGPEALKELRNGERTATIPVIFFTASVLKREKDGLVELGAEGVISKPFDPMALARQIEPYLAPLPSKELDLDTPSAASTEQPEPMKSLLYVSRSLLEEGQIDVEVQKIITTARYRNEHARITGALIFTHTHFVQYLEGPDAAINELVDRLGQDARHEDIRVVSTPPFSRRYFSDWSMAYGGSSAFVSSIVRSVFEGQGATSDPDKLIRLMREFTNDVRIAA